MQTREERIRAARNTLWTEHAKRIFDSLIVIYPEASIFYGWGDEGEQVNLVIKDGDSDTIISISGYK